MDTRQMGAQRKATRGQSKSPQARGEPVVRGILQAALEEVARAGYGALRIEDVAARAGVNKTTIYRRWPTKEDLVRAALLSITTEWMVTPSTGSLREDLLAIARGFVALSHSCTGQSLGRMMFAEGPDSELMKIARSLRQAHEAVPRSIIEAAQARGELAPGIDAMLVFDAIVGILHKKLLLDRESADDAFLARAVDLLLHGALGPQEHARPPARRTAAPRAAAPKRELR